MIFRCLRALAAAKPARGAACMPGIRNAGPARGAPCMPGIFALQQRKRRASSLMRLPCVTVESEREHTRVQPGDLRVFETMGLAQGSWTGEKNLLPAFADPKIAKAAGFKQAYKCLCSHSCEICEVQQTRFSRKNVVYWNSFSNAPYSFNF